MSEPYQDIHSYYFIKPQAAPADNTRVKYKTDPVPEPPKEPAQIEVRLSEGKFLSPKEGVSFNGKCKAQVKVEYLRHSIMTKITFCLYCTYKGKTEIMKPDKVGNEKNGIAETEFTIFYPDDYTQGETVEYFFKAAHRRGEKEVMSEKITMPLKGNGSFCFPLNFKFQDKGYKQGARAFGSSRNNGERAHAGCDLYAPAGENIYAVADGEVKAYHDFYMQTYAMVIDHKDYIVRYGEIQPPKDHDYGNNPPDDLRKGMASNVIIGSKVKKGQHIAYVGQLRQKNSITGALENYKQTMLHFEMFKGIAGGNPILLTAKDNKESDFVAPLNYERRKDLLNPTQNLDNATSI